MTQALRYCLLLLGWVSIAAGASIIWHGLTVRFPSILADVAYHALALQLTLGLCAVVIGFVALGVSRALALNNAP
jgi:hypothetical protein